MKNIYVYILIIGVILCIAGLWLSQRVEGFQLGTSSLVLGGIGTDGTVYLADAGLNNSPNWANASGNMSQISGSLGQFVGVTSGNVFYGSQTPGSPFAWKQITGTGATQVSFDYPKVAAVMGSSIGYLADVTVTNPTFTMMTPSVSIKWIDISIGAAYAVGTNNVYYCPNITASSWSWSDVTGSLAGNTFTQVSYDSNSVVVLTSNNNLWYASGSMSSPTWRQLTGKSVKQMTLKDNNIFAIGTDNNIWYSPSQTPDAAWSQVSGNMAYVDAFYPMSSNLIIERSAGNGYCTTAGYVISGNQCMSPCPAGTIASGTQCFSGVTNRATAAPNVLPDLTYTCTDTTYKLNLNPGGVCISTDKKIANDSPPSETYTVSGQFTQAQAKAKCESYGSKLASYDQVRSAQLAGWVAAFWGWIADDVTHTGQVAYVNATVGAGISLQDGGSNMYAATCYGIKPPKSFSNVLEFKAGTWNQATQCPLGYVLKMNANCLSSCPTGTQESSLQCTFAPTNKSSTAKINVNFTCPTGYDTPAVTACSKITANNTCEEGAPTCYESCPVGYIRSGTNCTKVDLKPTTVGTNPATTGPNQTPVANVAPVPSIAATGMCPTSYIDRKRTYRVSYGGGTTDLAVPDIIASPCIQPCPSGYTQYDTICSDLPASTATANPVASSQVYGCPSGYTYTGLSGSVACYNYSTYQGSSATSLVWTCPAGYDLNGASPNVINPYSFAPGPGCYPACPTGHTRIVDDFGIQRCTNNTTKMTKAQPTCPANYAYNTTTGMCDANPPCPSGFTLSNDQCTPNVPCPSDYTLSNGTCVGTKFVCPDGYDLDTVTNICYGKCPTGFTRSGTTCNPPANIAATAATRQTVAATFIPPCPTGYKLIGTVCYAACNAGDNDIGKQCQTPTVVRKTKDATISNPSGTICNTDAELINNQCVTKCPSGKVSTPTTCSNSASNRTVTSVKYTEPCNANEEILNDMCITKCPSGSIRQGSTCVPGKTRVTPPSSIKCTSSAYGKYLRWLCQSDTDLTNLTTDPSNTTTYVNDNDQVCSTSSPTTMMYYCQTVAESKAGGDVVSDIQEVYGTTCSNLIKSYTDLSNNLVNLQLIQSGLTDGTTGLATAVTSLTQVYIHQGCQSTPNSSLCQSIQHNIDDINNDGIGIVGVKTALSSSLEVAATERRKLLASIQNFQCTL